MSRSPLIPVVVGIAIIGGANFWAYRNWYAAPLGEKQVELQQVQQRTRSLRERTADMIRAKRDLDSLASRTLGRTAQTAEAALRSKLNDMIRAAGLEGVRVDTRVDRNMTVNPASDARLDAFKRRDERGRLRSTPEPAFVRMTATLSGQAATDKVVQALSLLESQEWLQRLVRVRLEPRDEGRRVDFVFEIETVYIPERSPESGPEVAQAEPDRASLATAVLARSPFRVPDPPQAKPEPKPEPKPVVQRDPEPPPPPPYANWFVSFLRDGSAGQELTIRRTSSNETRVLRVGERFHAMEFKGFNRIHAIFELEGDRYRIGVGQNLATRDNPEAVQ